MANSPIRVVFVSHSPRLEGAEQSMLQLVEKLAEEEKIIPLVVIPKKGKLENYLEDNKIQFIRASRYPWWVDTNSFTRKLLGPIKYLWNYISWYRIKPKVMAFQPDIIYINTLVTPFGSIISDNLGIPKIWHIREFVPKWLNRDYDFGRKWSLNHVAESAAIIANSQAVMDDIAEYIPQEKRHIVYNGINLKNLEHVTIDLPIRLNKTIKLLIVGSVNENKYQEVAVKSLSLLKQKNIIAELYLLGEEKKQHNYGDKLRQISKDLGVENQLHFVGWTENVYQHYQEADITLSCSKSEPFGRTIIESMAEGTPVISSNTGGAVEIIEKVDSELLFEEGSPKELANIIEMLMKDRLWYRTLVTKGRQVVEDNFSSERYIKDIYDIFSTIN